MSDSIATWIGVAIGAVSLSGVFFGYLGYRVQRNRVKLEYVVISTTQIVPAGRNTQLDVVHQGKTVPDAFMTILRLVNIGDKPIEDTDFKTGISIIFPSVQEIASATATKVRPPGLRPTLRIQGKVATIDPVLLNAEDAIEIQAITSGRVTSLGMQARIVGLKAITRRARLPYPPGSGDEGEMIRFDRFMWYVFMPVFLVLIVAAVLTWLYLTSLAIAIGSSILGVIILALYPLLVHRLIRRRRIWAL
jgi:hypothetical protein